MTTIADAILSHAKDNPEGLAVTCGGESLTWRQMAEGAGRMAGHFVAAGVRPGSLVVIGLASSVHFAQVTLAVWWVGATPAPLSPKLAPNELRGIIALAAPALAVGVAPEDASGHPVMSLDELACEGPPPPPIAAPSPSWKAIPSGGSTGRPKLIVAQVAASADLVMSLAQLLRVPSRQTVLVPAPVSHNAPFMILAIGLMLGNHVVLVPRFDAAECVRLVAQHAVRWLYLVPTMMLRIWRLPAEARRRSDLATLEVVFHMSAPCPPWLKTEWCHWLGADRIVEVYGGTEQQAICLVSGSEWLQHPGTVGRVVVGEMQVRNAEGAIVPSGEIGEVWMRRGAGVPSPYRYLGAEARAAADGWESLGDNGHFDAEGYLYLADRSTDMILVGGANVYPAEVEAALDEHPAVRSSCVIGLPHEDLGNAPHAIVELAEPAEGASAPDDEELRAWVSARVARYKVPRSFERVREPLRDEAGKVRRGQLRAARLQSRLG